MECFSRRRDGAGKGGQAAARAGGGGDALPARRRRWIALGVAVAVAVVAGGAAYFWPFLGPHLAGRAPPGRRPGGAAATRPARQWARRLDAPPLANFHQVSEDLYRGAQPDAAGMTRLKDMGIRTVVNLRALHSDRDKAGGAGLEYVHIPVNPFDPDEEEVAAFLRVVRDPARRPVFVHCQRGIDRTGLMCAAYRIAVCGWSKEEAIDEMTHGGFGYDQVFRNIVEYLWRLDVEKLSRTGAAGYRDSGAGAPSRPRSMSAPASGGAT